MEAFSFKRFLSLAMALLMVFSCVPVQAFATDGDVVCEEHTPITVVTDATCTADGTQQEICGVCGAALAEPEVIPAKGHSYVEGICTAENCGEKDPNCVPPETEHQHTWGDVYGCTATCEAAGIGYQACTAEGCTETKEVTVDATGHKYVDGKCACGAAEPSVEHEHSYEAVVTAPTCTAKGYTTYTCACTDSYTADEVAALGHNTDGENGACSFCGALLMKSPAPANVPADTIDMDFTDASGDESGDNFAWAQESKTLTLNGAAITEAVTLPAGSTIVVTEDTENSVTVASGNAIYSEGDLAISGSGKLTVESGFDVADARAIRSLTAITVAGTELTAKAECAVAAPSVSITDAEVDLYGYYYGIHAKTNSGEADSVVTLNNVSGKIYGYGYGGINAHSETANVAVTLNGCKDLTMYNEVNSDSTSVNFNFAGIRAYTRGNGKDVLVKLNGCKNVSISNSTMAILAANNANAANEEAAEVKVLIKDSENIILTGNTSCYSAVFVNNYGVENDDSSNLVIENSKVVVKAPNATALMTSTKSAPSKVDITGADITITAGLTGIRTIAASADYADTDVVGSAVTFTQVPSANYVDESTGTVAADETYYDAASTITVPNPFEGMAAKIGDEGFETLADAIAAANVMEGGATITLMDNVTLSEKLTIKKNITITGAYTITRGIAGTIFAVDKNATLTLDGGVIIDGNNDWTFDSAKFYNDLANYDGVSKDYGSYATYEDGGIVSTAAMISVSGSKGAVVMKKATIQNSVGEAVFSVPAGASVAMNEGALIQHCNSTGAVVAGQLKGSLTINDGAKITDLYGYSPNGGLADIRGGVLTVNGGEICYVHVQGDNNDGSGSLAQVYGTNSKLIVNGGNIHHMYNFCPAGGWGSIVYMNRGGSFEMNGGTIGNGNSDKCTTIGVNDPSSTVALNAGTINVAKSTAGTYDSLLLGNVTIGKDMTISGGDVRFCGTADNTLVINGTVNSNMLLRAENVTNNGVINGNVIITKDSWVGNDGSVTISGGTWNGTFTVEEGASLSITGGTFKNDPTAWLAEGCKVTKLADGTFGVEQLKVYEVATKAELDAALKAAEEGDVIRLTADIDYTGTATPVINKPITLDLGGKTLTTYGTYGGIQLKSGCSLVNGTLNHKGTVTAIKAWNVSKIENVTIDVAFKEAGKTIGGIVIQKGSTNRIDTIKNVTVKGEGLTNGIETYECGDATEPVIGSMENVTIDAVGTGMLLCAPCGTATNCSIKGGVSGIDMLLKGIYSVSLNLVDCDVTGGKQAVYAHDEQKGYTYVGSLSLTADDATTFASEGGALLNLKAAETTVVTLPDTLFEGAVANVNGAYYKDFVAAVKAANEAGIATVTLLDNVILGEKLTITGNVTISGEYTITRADSYTGTLFAVNAGATLTLDGGLVVDGANEYAFDAELYAKDLANWETSIPAAENAKWFTPEEDAPVATAYMITTSGTVNLNNVSIKNHYSTNGSGIVSASQGAVVTLTGAQITHNASTNGSGLVVNASTNVWSREEELITVTMNEGTVIDGNHVGGNHGLFKIYMGTYFTMNGGEVKNTTGWNSNGTVVGIYFAVFTMNGGTICSNSSVYGSNNGRNAAIYGHTNHLFTMNGGTICHNSGRSKAGIDSPYSDIGYTGLTVINGGSVIDNTVIGPWAEPDVSGGATLTVNGGTFTQDVAKWLAPNTGLSYNEETGKYGVVTEGLFKLHLTDPTTGEPATIPYIEGNDLAALVEYGKLFYADYYEMELEVLYDVKIDKTVVIDYPMTINLNGKTLTAAAGVDPMFRIESDVTVIGEGKMDARNGEAYVFILGKTDGTKGTLTINSDATFYGETSVASVTKGTLTINGGKFAVNPYKVEGEEDNYNFLLNCIDTNYKDGSAKIVVNGGVFYKFDPSNNAAEGAGTSFCAESYIAEELRTGYFTVRQANFVAQVGETKYESFDAALAAAKDGEVKTITLLAPVVISADANLDLTDLTINTNGDVYPAFRIQNGANVTVKGGTVTNDDYVFVLGASDGSSAGNLTIESGKFHGAITVASVTKGTLTVKGGEFSAEPYNGSYEFLLNCIDANYKTGDAKIVVTGGTFANFNPAANAAEGANTSFVPFGYAATEENNIFTVAEVTELEIWTKADLIAFAEVANSGNNFSGKTVKLMDNIDLGGATWTPIAKFAGKFYGNHNTIGNFKIDATGAHGGFFNVLEWATVEDVTLSDVTATVGNYRFGTLARSINQTNIDEVTVKNVTVTTTASSAFVAGLFCHGTVNSNMEVNNCTVENLTVNAERGAYLIGGITTFVQKNGTEAEGTNILEKLHVKNFKVTINDTDGVAGVGGLVGQTQSVWQNPRFNNCSVTGLDVTASGKVDVGGFMCYPGSWTYAENCTTEGKIDVSGVTSDKNFAGGFFGNYGWGDNVGKGDHKVIKCTADVDIITKTAAAGGFVGSGTNSEGRNKNITLTNCGANGTVTLAEGGTAKIGGFAGRTDRGIYENCTAAQEPFIGSVAENATLVNKNSYIAQVGDVYYATFEAALAAAKDSEDKDMTLLAPVVITADANLDLTDLTINTNGDVYPAFRIQNGANVNVKGGTVTNDDYVFVLGASDGSSAGNLTIESGKFHGAITVASVTKGTLTVKGGEFSAEPYNGSYEFLLNCIDANYKTGDAKIVVTGGTFANFNPANNAAEGAGTSFVAEMHEVTEKDGYYTVSEVDYVKWVKEQLLAGNDVTLDRDIVVDGSMIESIPASTNGNGKYPNYAIFTVIGDEVTFDLNGHTITYNGHADFEWNGKTYNSCTVAHGLFYANAGADLTIIDSSEEKTGTVMVYGLASGAYVASPDTTFTIEGGTWKNEGCKTCGGTNIFLYPLQGGELYIKGGRFEQALDSEGESYLMVVHGGAYANSVIDYSKTKLEISGGTFVGMNPDEVKYFEQSADNKLNMDKDPVSAAADGMAGAQNADGTWTVKPLVTVNFDNITMVEGNALPEFSYTTNFTEIAEDGEMLVVNEPKVTINGVGEYEITAEAYVFMSDKYVVEVVPGKLTVAKAVVEMDGKYYATIKDALGTLFSADTTVHTVKVLEDHEIDVNYSTYNYPILINGFAVELDLNGKTITADWSKYTGTRKDNALIGVCNGGKLDVIDSAGGGKIVNNDNREDVENRIFWIITSTATKSIVVNIKGGTFVQNDVNTALLYVQGNRPSDNLAPMYVNITGGHFETVNDDFFNAYDGFQHESYISGGTFNKNPTDWEIKIAEDHVVVENEDGTYGVKYDPAYGKVAKIGETYYKTLAAAIAAAKADDTITLLMDCDETVTIKQTADVNITIDGASKTYTGTIIVDGNRRSTGAETLTIKNVNFLLNGEWQSGIFATKNTYVHNLTVDDCSFTGTDAMQAYGIRLNHAYNITVKNTTGSKLYDLVYGQTSVDGFTAENVTVTDSGMGFMLPYGKNLAFKNVEMDVASVGVVIYNYNASSATFEKCTITSGSNAIWLEQKSATNAYSLTFNGINTFSTESAWLNVIGTEANFKVTVNDTALDMTKTSGLVASIGNVYYNSLAYAIADAKDGETVKVHADHALSEVNATNVPGNKPTKALVYVDKNIIIDLNGKELTAEVPTPIMFVFYAAEGANVTMIDSSEDETGTVNATGSGLYYMFNNAGTMTIESGNYIFNGINQGAMFFAENSSMTVNGGMFTQNNAGWMFNTRGNGEGNVITVNGGIFNRYFIGGAAHGENEDGEVKVPADKAVIESDIEGYWTLGDAVAKRVNANNVDICGYATLEEALTAAKSGETVVMLTDVTAKDYATIIPAGITLNLNGKYVTAKNLLAFGNVIDTAEVAGGLVISNDTSKAFTILQPENANYLPIYDTNAGCYRFYKYSMGSLAAQDSNINDELNDDQVRFRFRLKFDDSDAYGLLAESADSGVALYIELNWTGLENNIHYEISKETVVEFAKAAKTQLDAGGKLSKSMYLTVSGLKNLNSNDEINAIPYVKSKTGVTCVSKTIPYTVK